MSAVGIVDSGISNLRSVVRAVEACGHRAVVVDQPQALASVARVILPGVGSFPAGMKALGERELVTPLHELVLQRGVPVLGICLGMQLMATSGEEGGNTPGLGWIAGRAARLEPRPGERVPHVGWNDVVPGGAPGRAAGCPLFDGMRAPVDAYFTHSYRIVPDNAGDIAATTPFAGGFASAVQRGNIYGVQFHPEKSLGAGLRILSNFLTLT